MPLVVFPLTDVLSSVRPSVRPMPVFLIVSVVALIASTIGPYVYSMTVFLVIQPLSFVLFAIRPGADPKTFYSAVDPSSLVDFPSCIIISPFAISPALLEHSFVFIAITVDLYS